MCGSTTRNFSIGLLPANRIRTQDRGRRRGGLRTTVLNRGGGVLVPEGGTLSSGSRSAGTRLRTRWSRRLRFLEEQERRALHASGSRGNGRAVAHLGDGPGLVLRDSQTVAHPRSIGGLARPSAYCLPVHEILLMLGRLGGHRGSHCLWSLPRSNSSSETLSPRGACQCARGKVGRLDSARPQRAEGAPDSLPVVETIRSGSVASPTCCSQWAASIAAIAPNPAAVTAWR